MAAMRVFTIIFLASMILQSSLIHGASTAITTKAPAKTTAAPTSVTTGSTPSAGPISTTVTTDASSTGAPTAIGSTITTPASTPSGNQTYIDEPIFVIRIEGTFKSNDSTNFPGGCSEGYQLYLKEKAALITARANEEVGRSLCSDTEYVYLTADSTDLNLQNADGRVAFSFQKIPSKEYKIMNLETCAREIIAFLLPHSNWGKPIIGTVSGCPSVNWDSESFNTVYRGWGCGAA